VEPAKEEVKQPEYKFEDMAPQPGEAPTVPTGDREAFLTEVIQSMCIPPEHFPADPVNVNNLRASGLRIAGSASALEYLSDMSAVPAQEKQEDPYDAAAKREDKNLKTYRDTLVFTAKATALTPEEMDAIVATKASTSGSALGPDATLSPEDRLAYTTILNNMSGTERAKLYAAGGISFVHETILSRIAKSKEKC